MFLVLHVVAFPPKQYCQSYSFIHQTLMILYWMCIIFPSRSCRSSQGSVCLSSSACKFLYMLWLYMCICTWLHVIWLYMYYKPEKYYNTGSDFIIVAEPVYTVHVNSLIFFFSAHVFFAWFKVFTSILHCDFYDYAIISYWMSTNWILLCFHKAIMKIDIIIMVQAYYLVLLTKFIMSKFTCNFSLLLWATCIIMSKYSSQAFVHAQVATMLLCSIPMAMRKLG